MPRFHDLQRTALGLALAFGLLACAAQRPAAPPLQPTASRAAQPETPAAASKIARSFSRFCDSWMQKLSARNERNASKITYHKNGSGVVGEYTGYSREPLHCSVQPTGVTTNPFVGKLVYYEMRYQKADSGPRSCGSSPPNPPSDPRSSRLRQGSQGWPRTRDHDP